MPPFGARLHTATALVHTAFMNLVIRMMRIGSQLTTLNIYISTNIYGSSVHIVAKTGAECMQLLNSAIN